MKEKETHQKELIDIAKLALKPYGFKKINSKWTLKKEGITFIFTISKSWGDQYNIYCSIKVKHNEEEIWVAQPPIQRYLTDETNQYFVNFHPPCSRTETYKKDLELAIYNFGAAVKKINSFEDLRHHLVDDLKIDSSSFSAKARPLFFDNNS